MLQQQDIEVQQIGNTPQSIQRSGGRFVVQAGDQTWQASTLLLISKNAAESRDIIRAFGRKRRQPQIHPTWGGLETHRPGVFYINPEQDPEEAGAAVTARVNAWIGRSENRPPTAAVVDPERCRACKTCIDTCEYCAPELTEINGRYASWIDPAICTSCGTCAAHCPSGAITAGCSTDAQLDAMLDEILV
jgi:heterodisulfide reductase subunit A